MVEASATAAIVGYHALRAIPATERIAARLRRYRHIGLPSNLT